MLGTCRNGIPAVHYAGGMRTPLRGPLCDGRPSGLAGARPSPWRLAVGDLLTASLPVQALYAATVVAIAIALSLRAGQADLLGAVLASLAPRLALALAVNESFIACALALYRLIPNRAAVFGIMAVGFIAACVAQLSFPAIILPIHAGLWIHTSSTTALHTPALLALAFSGITGVIALALYAHMQR